MPNLYSLTIEKEESSNKLSRSELASILYHDVFDFPLTITELIKWTAGNEASSDNISPAIYRNGYFFLEGKEGIIYKRLLRKRISAKKLEIARRASKIISLIPTVLMVAVTGSLAMENASDGSDIDLMLITKKGTLWTTRLLVYLSFVICHLSFRRPFDRNQKDKLCLNMWLDESDLVWKKNRNLYTAHEIAQVKPIVSKGDIYERFLQKNRWVLDFWPNSVRIKRFKDRGMGRDSSFLSYFLSPLEKFCFQIQFQYMRKRISRETVTPTRALFHPQDWGEIVLTRLHTLV